MEYARPPDDLKAFRRCLGQFATGVTIVTTTLDGAPVGVTANSYSSVSLEPPMVLWSIADTSRSVPAFMASDRFAISVLGADQVEISNRFAKSIDDKFEGVAWSAGLGGVPLIDGALARIECTVRDRIRQGDHTIIVGEVERYAVSGGAPLLFVQGQYGVAADHPQASGFRGSGPAVAAGSGFKDRALLHKLGDVQQGLARAFRDQRQSLGINLAQGRTIAALYETPGLGRSELQSNTFLGDLELEHALGELMSKEFVETDGDGFRLCPEGAALRDEVMRRWVSFQQDLLGSVEGIDMEAFERQLTLIHEKLASLG